MRVSAHMLAAAHWSSPGELFSHSPRHSGGHINPNSGLVSWVGGMCVFGALVFVDVKYFNMNFILLAINCNFYCWFFKIVHVYFMIMQP